MREYLILRHGETDWNVINRIQGTIDVPLNERGRKQCADLAEKLSSETIHHLFSSPLQRALDTAKEIARRHGIDIGVDERLSELSQGEWNGKLVADLRKESKLYRKWSANPLGVTPPGGEALSDVFVRVREFLNERTEPLEGTIAIVSHKVVGALVRIILETSRGTGRPVSDVSERDAKDRLSTIWEILAQNVEVYRIRLEV
jgi:broad specificity phosphatase PhoE